MQRSFWRSPKWLTAMTKDSLVLLLQMVKEEMLRQLFGSSMQWTKYASIQ